MTVEFLLAKLKTLATNSDGVAWDGVEADLRKLILTESERAAALATESYFEFLADEILATSPGKVGA